MKSKQIIIGGISVICIVIIVIAWSTYNKEHKKLDFSTTKISIYHEELKMSEDKQQSLIKVADITEQSLVEKLVKEAESSDFRKQNSANMTTDWFIVFHDSGTVIAFSRFDEDYGQLGKDFHIEKEGEIVPRGVLDLYTSEDRYVKVPDSIRKAVYEYLKANNIDTERE